MVNDVEFMRGALSEKLFDLLRRQVDLASGQSPEEMLYTTEQHVNRAKAEAVDNTMVSPALAEAIVNAFAQAVARWAEIPEQARPWLLGAMAYFTSEDDEVHDFSSPIGFDDDTDVLNACLRLAELPDLCLDADDFGN